MLENIKFFIHSSQCPSEIESCKQALNVTGDTTKALRAALSNESFENWCNLQYQGIGVTHFKNHTPSNDSIIIFEFSLAVGVIKRKYKCNFH